MADRLRLKPEHRRALEASLREHLPGVEVWAYGSRVSGRGHDGSDLDLVLRGPGLEEIPSGRLADFEEAMRDSTVPFLVEARDWARLPKRFHREIERDRVVLVEKPERSACEGWPTARLGDCIEINDSTYSPKEKWPFVNYLDTGNITENRIAEIKRLIDGRDKIPSRARRKVRPGEIVYSTVRPNQRHFGLLRDIPDNFLASTGFSVIGGKEGVACTDFIYWFLAQDRIVTLLHSIAEHSTTAYPSIRPSDIEGLEIALPPLPEQRAIARVLGALDDKIALNRRMNETLEAMARALFESWFVDFAPVRARMAGRDPGLPDRLAALFPARLVDSAMGEIPEGWEISEIGREVDAVGGATPDTKNSSYWDQGDRHWVTPKDLSTLLSPVLLNTSKRITDSGVTRIGSGILPVGTVLLSSRAPIGYLAISEIPTAINQGFIAMICNRRLSNLYVLYWCQSKLGYVKSISGGSTFSEINKKTFRPIPVIVPSCKILTAYEDIARPLYRRLVENEKETMVLSRIRDTLLPRLVSGEVRIRDAERMLESVA